MGLEMGKTESTEYVEAKQQMHIALGRAISSWARVEGSLCRLFSLSVNSGNSIVGSEVFSSVKSHEVRVSITDAAFRVAYKSNSEALQRWTAILKRLGTARKLRSKLAHSQIVARSTKPDMSNAEIRIVPFHFMETHKDIEAFERHTMRQVLHYVDQFIQLADDIHKLEFDLRWPSN